MSRCHVRLGLLRGAQRLSRRAGPAWLPLLVLGLALSGCGPIAPEPLARISLTGLRDGATLAPTNASTIDVGGTAWLIQGGFPTGHVDWRTAEASGTASLEVDCFLLCQGHWSATVPLALGVNVVTFSYLDSSVSLTISRYPVLVISGRVALAVTGSGVPDVLVHLDGFTEATGPGGEYAFVGVAPGPHHLAASLPSPQFGECLTFLPASIAIEVAATDVTGQDFTAAQVSPCYGISGRITSSTDPGSGVQLVVVTLVGAQGATFQRSTTQDGAYAFGYLDPGGYTVTPSYCGLGCAQFSPPSRSVTIVDAGVVADFTILF
jgi:hypothetical protein